MQWWCEGGEETVLDYRRPSAFSNDWIIELLRRTRHRELQQIASRHWHRQVHVKQRVLATATDANTENPLLASFVSDSDAIHPYIEKLRNEEISPTLSLPPCHALSVQTRLDETRASQGDGKLLRFSTFANQGGLPWLVNLLLGPYRRSAWEPLLHVLTEALVVRLHHSGDQTEQVISLLAKTHPSHGNTNALELLLDQIDTLPSCSVAMTTQLGRLWNFLTRFHDIQWMQKLIQKYLCEVLLRKVVTVSRSRDSSPSKEGQEPKIQMHSALRKLTEVYHTPQRVFTTSSATKERLFVEIFLSSSLRLLRKYEQLVSFSPPSSPKSPASEENTSSVMWSGEEYEECLLSILDLFVTVTSQSVTGRYVAWLLCFWRPKDILNDAPFYYIHTLYQRLDSFPLFIRRRLEATLCTLELNCVEFLKVKEEWEENSNSKPVVKISIDEKQYHQLLGVDTALPDAHYLLDCANQNLYVPQMSLRYLSMKDYLVRNFALAKLNLSTSLWQSFTRSYDEQMHAVSVVPSNRTCHAHPGAVHVTVEVDHLSHLQYSDSSKKSKGFDTSPASIVFLLSWNEAQTEVHQFIPAHYCHHSSMKGNRVRATLQLPPGTWEVDTLTHLYVGNPALIASCRVHEVIHGLILKCTTPKSSSLSKKQDGVVFPGWFEEMISGKYTPTKLEQARQAFPESHYWMAAPHVRLEFLGLIEEEIFRDFLTSKPKGTTKPKRSHSPTVICDHCTLSCTEYEGDDEGKYDPNISLCLHLNCVHLDPHLSLRASQDPTNDFVGVPVSFTSVESSTSLQLYPTQQEAILSALFNRFTLIIGPPGTGKTCVTTQLIRLLYHNFYLNTPQHSRKKILMLAHSNNAVDQLIERVDAYEVPVLRLGSQTNSEIAQQCTYDGHLLRMQKDVTRIVHRVLQEIAMPGGRLFNIFEEIRSLLDLPLDDEIEELENSLSPSSCREALQQAESVYQRMIATESDSLRRSVSTPDDVLLWLQVIDEEPAYSEDALSLPFARLKKLMGSLCSCLRTLSLSSWEKRRTEIFDSVAVVAATCSGLAFQTSMVDAFDTIIIEEAGKVLELECLYAFHGNNKRIVLVGDDQQMRSLVHDQRLKVHSELDQPLLTRMQRLGMRSVQLDQQTRARSSIADLYRWRYVNLKDHDRVKDLSLVSPYAEGAYYYTVKENKRAKGLPEANAAECEAILSFAQTLLEKGVKEDEITLLTPYKQQKIHLSQECTKLGLFFTTHTVDEYQGKENRVVLLSMAFSGRSPSAFLCDERRVNVMTSRAQQLLVLFANTKNLRSEPAWDHLLSMMTELNKATR